MTGRGADFRAEPAVECVALPLAVFAQVVADAFGRHGPHDVCGGHRPDRGRAGQPFERQGDFRNAAAPFDDGLAADICPEPLGAHHRDAHFAVERIADGDGAKGDIAARHGRKLLRRSRAQGSEAKGRGQEQPAYPVVHGRFCHGVSYSEVYSVWEKTRSRRSRGRISTVRRAAAPGGPVGR